MQKVIDRNQKDVDAVHLEVYGPPQKYIEQKVLLQQKLPHFERTQQIQRTGVTGFEEVETRTQRQRRGYNAERSHTGGSKIKSSEVADFRKGARLTNKRTDVGHVRLARSTGRKDNFLIRENQRFKNIKAENDKLDYISQNFCSKNKKYNV